MKKFSFLAALAGLVGAFSAQADITVRVSVKAVLNPANGLRQSGVSDLTFSNTVVGMNDMLAKFGRGYHIQWVGNKVDNVGGAGQFFSGPSRYYSVDFVNAANGGDLKDQMEADAVAHPGTFGWDSAAVNVYIVQFGGANWNVCSFPGHSIVLVNGAAGYSTATTVLHEIGHFFNLSHTFNGSKDLNSNGSACTNGCNCAVHKGGGDDGVGDTILDNVCWSDQNDIAQGNYGMNYSALSDSRQAAVNRVWFDLMSYHNRQHTADRLTSDQLDRWADAGNTTRAGQVNGNTRFVDRGNAGIQVGSSTLPWKTLGLGVAVASSAGHDVVLVRPGNYNETMTITKPLTLRATRGNAVIGKP